MSVRRDRDLRVLERLTFKSRDVLKVRAFALRDEISSLLERNREGTGVHYVGLRRRSSAPGEPPAEQSGRLKNSIQARERNPDMYEVGPATESYSGRFEYPVVLEFGSRRMAPRPFMRPSVASFKTRIRGNR